MLIRQKTQDSTQETVDIYIQVDELQSLEGNRTYFVTSIPAGASFNFQVIDRNQSIASSTSHLIV
jgi:hypothetical protein